MNKNLAFAVEEFSETATGYDPTTIPLISPSVITSVHNADFLEVLDELDTRFKRVRRALYARYTEAVCPYQPGQVLDVDTSWIGRRRFYYKGATRFLVRSIRPTFWVSDNATRTRVFVMLSGCYLTQDGLVIKPEHQNGIPLLSSDWIQEDITLNTQGSTTVIGICADQSHKFDLLTQAAAKEPAA